MTTFTIMTWNVQNLFFPAHIDGPDTQGQFQRKVASLAAVIDQAQPHVVALQEVGTDSVLQHLQNTLTHPMTHAAEGQPDGRGIRVAFLSMLPFESQPHHLRPYPKLVHPVQDRDPIFDDPVTPEDESLTSMMGRGALEIVVNVGGIDVTLITAHFKSKLITYAREEGLMEGSRFQPYDENERFRYAAFAIFKRTAEAMTIRQRLNEILAHPAAPTELERGLGKVIPVICCGDFNDEPEAATTQIIKGPSGSEIGTGGFPRSDVGDAFRMWNLAPLLPPVIEDDVQIPAYTRKYKGRGEIIDHIFASHRLINPDNMPQARTIMNPDPLPNMGDYPDQRQNEPGSDHAAVVATFEI